MNAELCNSGLMTTDIDGYAAELLRYREYVKDARNKIISHLDRKTIIAGLPIGEHPEEEVPRFFDNLQRYADAVGDAVGVGPSDFQSVRGKGDVLDLIKVLKRAHATGVASEHRARPRGEVV